MNKLDEIRDEIRDTLWAIDDDFGNRQEEGFHEGWDAAIALNLPVKFAEWIREESSYDGGLVHLLENGLWHTHHILELPDLTSVELFDYWLEYIYKPE